MNPTKDSPLFVVILAAGLGKRMVSRLPKVLHPVAGRPMVAHAIDTANRLHAGAIHVVIGHGGDAVRSALSAENADWVTQDEQLGTGHAVEQAMPGLSDEGVVLVLYGDVPLVRPETLQPLIAAARGGALGLLTVELADPTGYGRVLRDGAGAVTRIVEEKDATDSERGVRECNTGILAAPSGALRAWLSALDNDNVQGEYYLTDIIAMAVADGMAVATSLAPDASEVMGANNRVQLAALERAMQARHAERLMLGGATLIDPARVDVRGEVSTGPDCLIDVNVILEGRVQLGANVRIGSNCVIRDCEIGDGTEILPNCVLESARVGRDCRVGPYARLRPDARLSDQVHVGNFVEIKKSTLGVGSKANHLTYIGDSEVGNGVNVGAGTITCNYDGANKHRTIIEDGAFIGSNTALVAPVRIGAGATTGAGSAVSQDVPADSLAVTRVKQRNLKGWQRPKKK
jgi:bifunctional UDP-N-acetylglucosamine pyrophosphorylase/glucosamine-1-phosphate N-acetyltransferase